MGWQRIFYPGMWAMRRLRIAPKLALLAVVTLLPLMAVQWQLVQHQHAVLVKSRSERAALAAVSQLTTVVRLVQSHRGLTNMVLSGNEGAKATRDGVRQSLSGAVKATSSAVLGVATPTGASDWAAMQSRLEGMSAAVEGKTAADSFALHTRLVEDLQRLVQSIGFSSGLLLESDPAAGLLTQMVALHTIPWAEQLGRLRGQGAGMLSQGAVAPTGSARMLAQLDPLEPFLRNMEHVQGLLGQTGLRDASADKALAASRAFAKQVREAFATEGAAQDAQAYFAAGTAAIEAVGAYQVWAAKALEEQLLTREREIEFAYVLGIVVSAAAVCGMLYLLVAFRLSFVADLRQVLLFLEEIAKGNLRHRARVRGRDELSDMSDVMERLLNSFSAMVASVRSNAALVSQSGTGLVNGSNALSDRTEQQAANLEQTNASVQELSSTVKGNAVSAEAADASARAVRDIAEGSASSMQLAVAQIEAIQASTQRMDEIVSVIDGLAFQTNILALNAAVEAARAGESGRGFAVVASEVRSLAQRSAGSAKEIRELITASSSQVGKGVELIRKAGASMDGVVQGIRSVAAKMSEISSSSAEQSTALAEISAAIRQLDEITQQNAAMVETAAQQASSLQDQASTLSDSVRVFQLQQGTADEALALVAKAMQHHRHGVSQDAFLRDLTAKEQGFFDRDMYVFALDRNGTYLAFGGNPAKVGTRVQDIAGIDGQGLMDAIIGQADTAPGWVQYDITNPSTGKVQTKMSYVCRLGDLYLGCGVYKNLVQA
ncbi:methyl-accepting chemotaxis protein [Curvibacter sp. APW13]|uniref:methyl-accepting chemotaxis protein n=1 Tax=Curvibacter sp. APW13 TaxID=3077236 RepID=UPI0028E0657E|nr:methyl-accepting chemotaxis protein [Curvibacter sp. APW13]MDT8992275.1 methyl-accepting chemotaxis protein [Curvibacter sp. APW13]